MSEAHSALATIEDFKPKRLLRADTIGEFVQLEIPPREMILGPVIPAQGLVMVYAPRGVGKTLTTLGMAYAVGYDVYRSMDALEQARAIDPEHFWAQLKYAELHYRLRALNRAERETRRAADLAANPFQLAIARKQMKEIRELQHSSIRNVEWTKPLTVPALVLTAMFVLMFVIMGWR